jgi:hypothetical protein
LSYLPKLPLPAITITSDSCALATHISINGHPIGGILHASFAADREKTTLILEISVGSINAVNAKQEPTS